MEARGISARDHSKSGRLCLLTHDGHLELWDMRKDHRLFSKTVRGAKQLEALGAGCLVLTGKNAVLHDRTDHGKKLVSGAVAIAYEDGEVLVATNRRIWSFDDSGTNKAKYRVNFGVRTMLRVGDALVLGFEDGKLEVMRPEPGKGPALLSFADTPSSPAVRMRRGPGGTLVAGFANGVLGIWDQKRRIRLDHVRLHGPVSHLLIKGSTLFAATDLGDYTVLNLEIFSQPYCDLVREVGRRVPVVWTEGKPVRQAAAVGRGCLQKSGASAVSGE